MELELSGKRGVAIQLSHYIVKKNLYTYPRPVKYNEAMIYLKDQDLGVQGTIQCVIGISYRRVSQSLLTMLNSSC